MLQNTQIWINYYWIKRKTVQNKFLSPILTYEHTTNRSIFVSSCCLLNRTHNVCLNKFHTHSNRYRCSVLACELCEFIEHHNLIAFDQYTHLNADMSIRCIYVNVPDQYECHASNKNTPTVHHSIMRVENKREVKRTVYSIVHASISIIHLIFYFFFSSNAINIRLLCISNDDRRYLIPHTRNS